MISLDKRTEVATQTIVDLGKKTLSSPTPLRDGVEARVVLAIDYSGSMGTLYRNGTVQDAVERTLALSLAGLDDDGDIQIHFFDSRAYKQEVVDVNSYPGFVDKWSRGKSMGGTNYSQVMSDILTDMPSNKKRLFGKTPKAVPTFVLFITDGAPGDKAATEALLRKTSDQPVFWQFLGLGSSYETSYLDTLNKLPNRQYDNTGLTRMSDMSRVDDVTFFNDVLGEFVTEWLPQAQARGIA